jgi:hypothetical protein
VEQPDGAIGIETGSGGHAVNVSRNLDASRGISPAAGEPCHVY